MLFNKAFSRHQQVRSGAYPVWVEKAEIGHIQQDPRVIQGQDLEEHGGPQGAGIDFPGLKSGRHL